MIDIHNHLVPGVDDGSDSLETSRKLIERAIQDGITDILTTPHFIKGNKADIERQEMLGRFEQLKEDVKDLKINLYLGNELYIDYQLDELLMEKRISSLNDSRFVLVEFPFTRYEDEYDEYLYNISLNYEIIIAHPERYEYVQKDLKFTDRWLENNYYLQVNQDSFFASDRKKTVLKMVEEGLVSMVASDGHNLHRPVVLKDCYEFVRKKFSKDIADKLFEINPRHIINDEEIEKVDKCRKRWF